MSRRRLAAAVALVALLAMPGAASGTAATGFVVQLRRSTG
jgi:hypothetical protein